MNISSLRAVGVVSAATAVMCLSITACEEERKSREYKIPEMLCDVDVRPDKLAPFLPPGEEIELNEEGDEDFRKVCSASVDGEVAFEVKREWWEDGWSTRRFATVHAYVKPDHQTADEKYVYSKDSGLSVMRCSPKRDNQDLFIVVKSSENTADEEAMLEFLIEYREVLMKRTPCDEVE
ncbi:hypothetical protein [Streptomyces sp. SS8]